MIISNHIEKTEDGLEQLIDAATRFEENHYLDAVRQKKLKEYDILSLTEDVVIWHGRMRKESLRLAAFSETFLEQFATDNNKCFHEAYNLFSKIRSTISGSRKVFRKFCRRVLRNPTNPAASNSLLSRSLLSSHAVSQDIFGMASYDDKVLTLYDKLKEFFSTLIITLSLCHRIICDEAAIKKDGGRCLEIYQKCRQQVLESARLLAKTFNISTQQISKEEYIERRRKAKNIREYAQDNYHKRNKAEFMTIVAYEVIAEGNSHGLTEIESMLWADNPEKVKEVRYAITRLDDIVGTGKKNIDGKLLLEFIKWSGVNEKHERKLYNYLNDNYHGKKHIVGWTQVCNTRKDYRESLTNEQLTDAFAKELNDLVTNVA